MILGSSGRRKALLYRRFTSAAKKDDGLNPGMSVTLLLVLPFNEEVNFLMGRKLLIVLLLFLAAAGIQGCGGQGGAGSAGGTTGNSPQQAITGLTTAIQNGDISGALAYVGKASQDKFGSALQRMDTSARLRLAVAVLGSKKVSESGNRSVYKGTIILPNGQTVEETFEIITEEGIWKFVSL
jgi:hypothetical protein